jgi:hypothetical protein
MTAETADFGSLMSLPMRVGLVELERVIAFRQSSFRMENLRNQLATIVHSLRDFFQKPRLGNGAENGA